MGSRASSRPTASASCPSRGPPTSPPAPHKESAPSTLYNPPRGQREEQGRAEGRNSRRCTWCPPPAWPCPTTCDDIYKVPRATRRDRDPSEVLRRPLLLPRDAALSDTYDTPTPFPKQAAPDTDPYNVPPASRAPPGPGGGRRRRRDGRKSRAPIYATPSNLRRASALLNLYESPEELLGGEYDLPGPPPPEAGSIQDRPLPPPPPRLGGLAGGLDEGAGDGHSDYEGIRLAEEYDYVHLKGTDRLQPPATDRDPPRGGERPQTPTRDPHFCWRRRCPPALRTPSCCSSTRGQCRTHCATLLAATEALLASARANQPPGVFVPHGRFVLVTAHKLVFVGDTLARQAASAPLRARVGAAAGALCQALKGAVLSVKGAALSYPSPPAARLLRERLAELSRRAQGFTSLLSTLAPS
ncbi:unnamed protein product [Lepidochelys kempii]